MMGSYYRPRTKAGLVAWLMQRLDYGRAALMRMEKGQLWAMYYKEIRQHERSGAL